MKPSLVEIRYDLVRKSPDLVAAELNDTILQVATCRPGIIPDRERKEILKRAIDLGAVYVDVEIDSDPGFIKNIKDHAAKKSCHLILSYHNYDETPPDSTLHEILSSCYELGADVAKIACQSNSRSDAARLLSLYGAEGRKIVIGMGEGGRVTRIAALGLGAEFTFAGVSTTQETAPGQYGYKEMIEFEKLLKI